MEIIYIYIKCNNITDFNITYIAIAELNFLNELIAILQYNSTVFFVILCIVSHAFISIILRKSLQAFPCCLSSPWQK